jgi:integrase/recombinase XerD
LVELEERGLKPNSIHSHARAIKTFLRFAYAEGYLPLIQVDLPIVPEILPEILSTDDIRRVLRACRRTRDRVIVMMLLDTGMRRGELLNLKWSDIDLDNGSVIIRKTKSNKFRIVRMGIKTRRALLKILRSEGQVIRLRPSGLRMVFRRLSDRSGVKVTPHMLRRTCATWHLASGTPEIALQSFLGHSDLSTTRRYVKLSEIGMKSVIDRL